MNSRMRFLFSILFLFQIVSNGFAQNRAKKEVTPEGVIQKSLEWFDENKSDMQSDLGEDNVNIAQGVVGLAFLMSSLAMLNDARYKFMKSFYIYERVGINISLVPRTGITFQAMKNSIYASAGGDIGMNMIHFNMSTDDLIEGLNKGAGLGNRAIVPGSIRLIAGLTFAGIAGFLIGDAIIDSIDSKRIGEGKKGLSEMTEDEFSELNGREQLALIGDVYNGYINENITPLLWNFYNNNPEVMNEMNDFYDNELGN